MTSRADKTDQALDSDSTRQTISIGLKNPNTDQNLRSGSDIISFCYLPELKSLSSWSSNASGILGINQSKFPNNLAIYMRNVHPDDLYQLLKEIEKTLVSAGNLRTTFRWIKPDSKETRWLHCRADFKKDESGRSVFEGILLDLTDEFCGSQRFFSHYVCDQDILAALPGLAFSLDADLRVVRIKKPGNYAEFCFGDFAFRHEKFRVGGIFTDCFADQDMSTQFITACKAISQDKKNSYSLRIFEQNKNYKLDFVSSEDKQNSEGYVICLVSDITSLVSLENRLAFLHKAESLRRLSAGVGHHFNNALQSILGQATFIASRAENPDLVRQTADTVIETSLKAAELTRQLFLELDNSAEHRQETDINLLLTEVLMKSSIPESSALSVSLVLSFLPLVQANRDQLITVFENLIQNAHEATNQQKFRQLQVKTSTTELESESSTGLSAGSYVLISFKDNGRGMNQEILRNCLDPFYSTKAQQHGFLIDIKQSGLGLPKVFSILKSMGGSIKIRSSINKGSKIEVFLPIKIKTMPISDSREISYKRKHPEMPPRVLLIDDDESVALAAMTMLQAIGEECEIAHNHTEAIAKLKKFIDSIELIFLDAIFPQTDSAILLKKLKKIKPDIKVIGFSGAGTAETDKLLKAGALSILCKPVGISDFKDVLKQHLQAVPGRATAVLR